SWVLAYADSSATAHVLCDAATISTGVWYLVTGTWDSSTNLLTLYINGVQAAQASQAQPPTSASGGDLNIAAVADAAYFLNGTIDDARVYNRALSATEVLQIYNNY